MFKNNDLILAAAASLSLESANHCNWLKLFQHFPAYPMSMSLK